MHVRPPLTSFMGHATSIDRYVPGKVAYQVTFEVTAKLVGEVPGPIEVWYAGHCTTMGFSPENMIGRAFWMVVQKGYDGYWYQALCQRK